MDKIDKISIGIFVASFILIALIIYFLTTAERTLLNLVSIVGSIFSTEGMAIAVLQILKIKGNNDTFINTLKRIENNSIISVISRSIEQVRLIKLYFELQKTKDSRSLFNILRNDINDISFNNQTKKYGSQLAEFIEFCSLTETQLFDGRLGITPEALSDKYTKLSELETLLQQIKSEVVTPNQENI